MKFSKKKLHNLQGKFYNEQFTTTTFLRHMGKINPQHLFRAAASTTTPLQVTVLPTNDQCQFSDFFTK